MTLAELPTGKTRMITEVTGEDALRRHLLHLGFAPGNKVQLVRRVAPGGAIQVHLKGCDLALSRDAARCIRLGETAPKGDSLPKRIPIAAEIMAPPTQFALVGSPNCGKSTLFNVLTGASQRVGNFPGVTVERKSGRIQGRDTALTDLPGVYSLSPFTLEESVTADYLHTQHPAILHLVSASNLEGSLGLTLELLALKQPMVVALSMMDEVEKNGGAVDVKALSRLLGVEVVPISAVNGKGIQELTEGLSRAKPPKHSYRGTEHQLRTLCRTIAKQTIRVPEVTAEYRRSLRIDRLLAGTVMGLLSFPAIMAGLFWLTFGVVGPLLSEGLSSVLVWLGNGLESTLSGWQIQPILRLLIMEGIWRGICTVLGFLPTILVLFFCLSLLEDSGYLARVAFRMDGLLRPLGLSGRSMVPLLLGFGCTVPAVMACRTLPGDRERRSAIFLLPFMSCSAKLPVYAFFAQAFFPACVGQVTALLYLLGILLAILLALTGKGEGKPRPLVLELPNYRLPTLRNTWFLLRQRTKDFLQKVFTLIFLASLTIWLLQNFDITLHFCTPEDSILAGMAGLLVPLFHPLGLGDWRIITALLTGAFAKEAVVSTLAVLVGEGRAVSTSLSTPAGAAMLVFCLLYPPCMAAMAIVRRELGTAAALRMLIFQWGLAWLLSWMVYQVLTGFI